MAWLALALLGLTAGHGHATATTKVQTEQVKTELLAHAPEGIVPGRSWQLGLRIDHAKHWHTYWKNAGDSGLGTTFTWTLPAGLTAGDIEWPTPKKLPVGPLMNHGYEGTLVLPVTVTVAPDAKLSDAVDIKLHAQWLVCKEVCIPQEGHYRMSLPTRAATAVHGALFAAAAEAMPVASKAQARAEVQATALALEVSGLPDAWQGKPIEFFPELGGVVAHAMKPVERWEGSTWKAQVPLSSERHESPSRMDAVLVTPGQRAQRIGFDIKGTWPALGVGAQVAVTHAASAPAAPPVALGMGMALLWALIGGLILNLMPCVLPVLSLKVLAATQTSSRTRRVAGGMAYTAGVVLSFMALAALLLALRAGGEAVGWGFQLQSPAVVAALAALFTLIGLNLAGVFELNMVLPGNLATTTAKNPALDSFLTGVLAVAVAAPCTAPFMGAALGHAVTMPAPWALLVFAALGLGMALPYLAVTLLPRVARWLPKPGGWMSRFKVLMAFPMFATAVWLVWVLGLQVGIDGAAALLAVLVALSFAVWILATSRGASSVLRWAFAAAGLAVLAATLSWAWPMWSPTQQASERAQGAERGESVAGPWQPWSPDAMRMHLEAGRPVFVDFTAAWCVSCQLNKRTTLQHTEVMQAFERLQIVRMRADWTHRDATIAAELTRLNRTGVPVYAIYQPGQAFPTLLPELLTPATVIEALKRLN